MRRLTVIWGGSSNVQKRETAKLIQELSRVYGDLGFKFDKNTGRYFGIDAAIVKKATIDRNRGMADAERELKLLEVQSAILRENLENSHHWWNKKTPPIILIIAGALCMILPFFKKR